jgi:ABC-type nitrate/sulfonate/bicarbonate transport system substrate-binding protein
MRVNVLLTLGLLLAGCAPAVGPTVATPVTLMLDWVPNTNHTGLFVAQDNGYFADAGLQVDIVQPGEVYAEQAVAGGAADFGVSFQEQLTLARADEVPLVSIAAILQHNTSAFAARAGLGGNRPAGWEGLRYGSFGSPFERPTIGGLMQCEGADVGEVDWVQTGFTDPLSLLEQEQIDLAWIFYGWQGIQAEQMGIDLNVVMMADYFDSVPDFYTPVVITSEAKIAERPDLVAAVLRALSRGYTFAAEHPDEAAEVLLSAVPELDRALAKASQRWLSDYYIAEASRWGEQKESVWRDYADWMVAQGIMTTPVAPEDAFTNRFLP